MNIIILAAGIGSRAYPLTKDTPKCLLKVGGQTILERAIKMLDDGKNEIYIVTGFQQEKIKTLVRRKGLNVTLVNNPFYRFTNSIASLHKALVEIRFDRDLLIINSDICFDENILSLIDEFDSDFILYDSTKKCTDADYKIVLDEKGFVKNMGKLIEDTNYSGEYIGITKLGCVTTAHLFDKIYTMLNLEDYNTWYETALLHLLKEKRIFLKAKDVKDRGWVEIDRVSDFKRANLLFKGN